MFTHVNSRKSRIAWLTSDTTFFIKLLGTGVCICVCVYAIG